MSSNQIQKQLTEVANSNNETINRIQKAIEYSLRKQGMEVNDENINKYFEAVYSGKYNYISNDNGYRQQVIGDISYLNSINEVVFDLSKELDRVMYNKSK